ncbi:MAG: ATP-dependent Clp protease ATP-binding subunit [Bacteroidota bacterium]
MNILNYTDELKKVVSIAQSLAKEYQNNKFSGAHLLKALLHKDIGLLNYLISLEKDVLYLEEWAEVRIESLPKSGKLDSVIRGDESIATIFEEAENVRLKLGKQELDPICLLAALSTAGVAFSYDELKTYPITQSEIISKYSENADFQNAVGTQPVAFKGGDSTEQKPSGNALQKYCVDKTALAREKKLDPIIGRDKETRMVAEILGRRTKPNVIIIGEPGVGKTALIDGFAINIVEGKVPDNLKGAQLFELDFGSLVAGASYKGEVEDRLKGIIKEIKQFPKAILFIDEIHTLLDKNGGASGTAQLLKPELARGELIVIGATTNDEYRKHIEKDEAFSRRFEVIKVDEPSEIVAARMLEMIIPYYEKHHSLGFEKDAILDTIKLAKRYDKDRRLPDSAIDLMDRTMAAVKMMAQTSMGELELLKAEVEKILEENPDATEITDIKLLADLKWFYNQLKDKISPILMAQIDQESEPDKMELTLELGIYLKDILGRLIEKAKDKKESVDKIDVLSVVSHKMGIPLGKVQASEKERLLNMEDWLKKRVVGQDQALKAVSEAILESRSGLNKAGQPIASFFLLGPTGTGKTELAKSLAEFLFTDETSMIRFDMSEFKEEHSAALLYGAPPGYVGYEEGGILVNKIRQQPYSIVLFDEIEKAHPSVFDLFLQIMDEGKLHDRLGKVGEFSNAVILFTSNIGSEFVAEKFMAKEVPKSNDLMEIMQRFFRPEFLARLTEIVPFSPIMEENVVKIFDIHVKSLLKTLEKQGITLVIENAAKEKLAKSGFTPKYGARPITGVIRLQLRRPISKMIIAGTVTKGNTITLSLNEAGEYNWDIK